MNSKSLIEQSKYEEYLQSVELEQVTRPNLFKHQDYQPETISVNKIKLSKQDYCRVLFIPTRLYKNDLYEINFRGDQINLLNCMYKYGIQGEISYISLLDISNKPETLISYEFKIQDAQSKINFKAGVLGGKYILLSLQSATEVELHILNLDLTLIMKHNFKDSFYIKDQEYIFDNHMPEEDLGEFENNSNMNLVDWREKDLFQNQMSTDDNSDQSGIALLSSNIVKKLNCLPICNGKLGKSFDKRIKNYLYNDNKSEIIFIEDDQDYGGPSYYNLCSILPKEQDDGLYNKVLELKTYIMSYSKFEKDSYNNLYLPMTYKEDEQLYFGIYDVNSKSKRKQAQTNQRQHNRIFIS
ncbi:hypothetical protein TTHERM_00310020 (macronuclear) [Tetrahymena thermophila SB210]|uniref:Uncharacterized protein n=1 Tax=Tetrahymena thermophila (strain SB210) TaxID=312017 RepID=I7MFZ8_TETTS|nr:hypothetical protein TTHERM_00310020 [Tetrahymena thermophila SB210]EAS00833.2 hypothetical protein TTHERM_00310020 [Tetrahymena thermophila SB210]|eukprot:XP_001021078.2 hypothetical protein TTHERM_00310020 [Tetrahymena thermophila SB210]